MPTRDDFRFVLLPWEHRGAHFDARPDCVAEWRGDEDDTPRHFLLKAKRNLLFFRDADQSDEFLCALETPLFTDVPPEDELRQWMQENRELVADFWREEVRAGNYGRCLIGEHPHAMGTFLLFFKRDGGGWLREPWDAGGLSFDWEGLLWYDSPLFDWPIYAFPSVSEVIANDRVLQHQIEEREMPEEAIEEQVLEWVCGSREELEQITRYIAFTEPQEWFFGVQKRFVYGCESQEARAALEVIYEGDNTQEKSVRMQALTDLALDYNTPVGIRWVFCDGSSGDPPIRGSWEPEEPTIQFVIECPSEHERLEAYHELRAWLRDKVSAADIEKWLSPLG